MQYLPALCYMANDLGDTFFSIPTSKEDQTVHGHIELTTVYIYSFASRLCELLPSIIT